MSNGETYLADIIQSSEMPLSSEDISYLGNQAVYGNYETINPLPTGNLDLADIYSPYYNPASGAMEYPSPTVPSNAPSSPSLSDVLGKVFQVGGKTLTDILSVKYAQPLLKTVPSSQSGIEKYLYYPTKTPQTGLGLTTYAQTGQGTIAGVPINYLLIGVAVLAVFFLVK